MSEIVQLFLSSFYKTYKIDFCHGIYLSFCLVSDCGKLHWLIQYNVFRRFNF